MGDTGKREQTEGSYGHPDADWTAEDDKQEGGPRKDKAVTGDDRGGGARDEEHDQDG